MRLTVYQCAEIGTISIGCNLTESGLGDTNYHELMLCLACQGQAGENI